MSQYPTHRDEHRSGGEATTHGVVVPLPVRRADPSGVASVHSGSGHGRPGPGVPAPGLPGDGSFTVDCADCAHRLTSVCDDCVVSFIVGREPEDAVVVDADEARAVRLLAHAGLVPGVRHEAQASGL